MSCRNAVVGEEVRRHFEVRARRDYVGQQQAWDYVRSALDSYIGLTPRTTCKDWVLHFTGPSGSGKTFLAEIIASSAFEEWEDEMYSWLKERRLALMGSLSLGGLSAAKSVTAVAALGGPIAAGAAGSVLALGMSYLATSDAVLPSFETFQSPKLFPGQCGVFQHKFSRGSDLREVEAFEFAAAELLKREPKAVIILDDVGRLADAEAYAHLGKLLCGLGGNTVPHYRTQRVDPELVSASGALFILTSDLVLPQSSSLGGCGANAFERDTFEQMLGTVKTQSIEFWKSRKQLTPDWWDDLPIVPFRELCADEIIDAVKKYLQRQCDNAEKRLDADMKRRDVWGLTWSVTHKWIGSVRHGPRSLAVLEEYAAETAARNSLDGGRQGAWVIQDFHHSVMKPAFSRLMLADEHGGTLLSGGGHTTRTRFPNITTLTYTSQICLSVTRADSGTIPTIRFERMKHWCE